MARVTFDVDLFNRHLARLPEAFQELAQSEAKRGAEDAARTVKTNLPLGPEERGHIKDTVRVEQGRTDLSFDLKMGHDEGDFIYGQALEWGNLVHGVVVPATPVFFPAVKKSKRRTRARLRNRFKKIMRDNFRK